MYEKYTVVDKNTRSWGKCFWLQLIMLPIHPWAKVMILLLFICFYRKTRSFPGGSGGKEHTCQWRRPGFDPWVGKIPGDRNGKFLPVKSSGQWSPLSRGPWVETDSPSWRPSWWEAVVVWWKSREAPGSNLELLASFVSCSGLGNSAYTDGPKTENEGRDPSLLTLPDLLQKKPGYSMPCSF